jgi:hypothetical protein
MRSIRPQEEQKLDPDFLDSITSEMRAELLAEEPVMP